MMARKVHAIIAPSPVHHPVIKLLILPNGLLSIAQLYFLILAYSIIYLYIRKLTYFFKICQLFQNLSGFGFPHFSS